MQTKSRFWKFWKSLPGMLTAIAALLTAIAGAYGVFGPKPNTADKLVSGPVKPGPTEQQRESSPTSSATARANAIAAITESDGNTIMVSANSVTWMPSITPREFSLNSGQSISFDRIKSIDILNVEDMTTTVQVILADGQTIQGSVDGGRVDRGTRLEAASNAGKVSVRISLVKRVDFQR